MYCVYVNMIHSPLSNVYRPTCSNTTVFTEHERNTHLIAEHISVCRLPFYILKSYRCSLCWSFPRRPSLSFIIVSFPFHIVLHQNIEGICVYYLKSCPYSYPYPGRRPPAFLGPGIRRQGRQILSLID